MAEKKATKTTKSPSKTATKPVETVKEPKVQQYALSIPVYGLNGKEEKTLELEKDIFGQEVNRRLVAQYVRVYLANQRQGTASTKTRSEVRGTTKKVYRQKGTGNARHGSAKAPIFVGGGVTGGPKPTDHSLKLNKKQRQKALLYALTMKAQEGALMGLGQDVVSMQPKTKDVYSFLKTLGLENKKVMVVTSTNSDTGFLLSLRNLVNIDIVPATNLNPYGVLNHARIAFTEEALSVLINQYKK